MEAPYREITVQGHADAGTVIKVHVDGILVKDGSANPSELFTFKTQVTAHGLVPISIEVVTGRIVLGGSVSCYPARINDIVDGFFSFKVPMPNMLVTNELVDIVDNTTELNAGDTFNCNHLLINGPYVWDITIDQQATPGMKIYTEDIDNPDSVITCYRPRFMYNPYMPSHQDNQNIIELKKQLRDPLYNAPKIDFDELIWNK